MSSHSLYIAIRVDSSIGVGWGHVMRCLTLADKLREDGARVLFVCRPLTGDATEWIKKHGYEVCLIARGSLDEGSDGEHDFQNLFSEKAWKEDARRTIESLTRKSFKIDWMVVDHYGLGYRWEEGLRPFVSKIMVIDDLANRKHSCDLLLDQNLNEDMEARYDDLVPPECVRLLGPKYALLRPEFREARKKVRKRDGDIKRIIIFFGSGDPTNETGKALEIINLLNRSDIDIDVVVGDANTHAEKIADFCSSISKAKVYSQARNMSELMVNADMALGAGGSTTWERCSVGLPALVWCIAENQRAIASYSAQAGVCVNLGMAKDVSPQSAVDALRILMRDKEVLSSMTRKCLDLVDGDGLSRVAAAITKKLKLTVVSDGSSWINNYIPELLSQWRKDGHAVHWVHDVNEIEEGDCAFFLGCCQIAGKRILLKNSHNLVVHESDLPEGRGWSPLTWKILEGENEISITLLEAALSVDSGDIYLADTMLFDGAELVDELRAVQAEKTILLCCKFIASYPEIASCARRQEGSATYFSRRIVDDSELDPDKTLREQFNLLRIVDNDKYPAFMKMAGKKFILKIEKG